MLALAMIVTGVILVPLGCQTQSSSRLPGARPLPETEPALRVRIKRDAAGVSFSSEGGLWIGPPGNRTWKAHRQRFDQVVTIVRRGDRFIIAGENGASIAWPMSQMMIVGYFGKPVLVDGDPYPHTLVLHGKNDEAGDRFDVINHVKLETYLPGVLHGELYSHWHPAAFRAQAIAARTYALHTAWQAGDRHYDLESTTASQVYVGAGAHDKARQAVQRTEGMVLVYDEQLVPAYYSSCCGGTSQDAALAFPHGSNIPPLRGKSHDGWCQQAPSYRWGPIDRRAIELTQRMRAWGAAAGHPIRQLTAIADIQTTATNSVGRPARFAVLDANGKRYDLDCEQFRFACNASAPELADLPRGKQLKSSHVTPQVYGAIVRFTDGQGHGHGVGLCQYGAQALAKHGYSEFQIVSKYYPQAKIRRLY
jgi:stage II sporulation protein D